MNVRHIDDLETPIRDILRDVGTDGVVLESAKATRFAVLPLDDDLIDYLLERNSRFAEVCDEIRERMRAGRVHSHADVRKAMEDEAGSSETNGV